MTTDELKKEAEEYAEGMAKYYASTHEDYIPSQFEKYLRKAYISSAEPREKRIEELEKENAELKSDNTEWERASDKWKSVYELTNNQLTKAKELLKQFLKAKNSEDTYKAEWETEQFLKDREVEK